MKKTFKILLAIVLFLNLCFVDVSALDTTNLMDNEQSQKELEISFDTSNGITPKATFYGDGGTSKLNYGESGRTLTWQVITPEVIVLTGNITIYLYSTGVEKATYVFSGTGSNLSGTVSIGSGLKSGTKYKAQLYGVGVALSGNKYRVVDNAYITFTYK